MKIVSLAYSKLRNNIGLVGIEARGRPENCIHVKLVRQWDSKDINEIPPEVANLYHNLQWDLTYIEQETGEYVINLLKNKHEIPCQIINTKKNVKDPKELQKIRTMDKIEMTEFLRQLKLNGQIRFPAVQSENMTKLEKQIPFFAKHTTEAGSIDYYTPGEEPDDLVKALMMSSFAARNIISGDGGGYVVCGNIDFQENNNSLGFDENIFGDML